jgi:enoyl-CoA hydratase/carnithine racemase
VTDAHVRFDVEDHVATVTIDRPEVMNALSPRTDDELAACWQRVREDDDIWFAVLDAAGDRAFCAGADLRQPRTGQEPDRPGFGGGLTGIAGTAEPLGKPLVGVVRGWAIGGGFELALACDLLVAGESARFTIPEAQLGILGQPLALHRAVRRLPRPVVVDLVLTGRVMDAAEADRRGLFSRLAADDRVDGVLAELVGQLRAGSPLAQLASLAVVEESESLPLAEAEGRAYAAVADYLLTDDYAEAIAANSDMRPPIWLGH